MSAKQSRLFTVFWCAGIALLWIVRPHGEATWTGWVCSTYLAWALYEREPRE